VKNNVIEIKKNVSKLLAEVIKEEVIKEGAQKTVDNALADLCNAIELAAENEAIDFIFLCLLRRRREHQKAAKKKRLGSRNKRGESVIIAGAEVTNEAIEETSKADKEVAEEAYPEEQLDIVVQEAANHEDIQTEILNAVVENVTEELEAARVALNEAIEVGVDFKTAEKLVIELIRTPSEDNREFIREFLIEKDIIPAQIASAEAVVKLYFGFEDRRIDILIKNIVMQEVEMRKIYFLYLITTENAMETALNTYIQLGVKGDEQKQLLATVLSSSSTSLSSAASSTISSSSSSISSSSISSSLSSIPSPLLIETAATTTSTASSEKPSVEATSKDNNNIVIFSKADALKFVEGVNRMKVSTVIPIKVGLTSVIYEKNKGEDYYYQLGMSRLTQRYLNISSTERIGVKVSY
jgi:hypothetical protein